MSDATGERKLIWKGEKIYANAINLIMWNDWKS